MKKFLFTLALTLSVINIMAQEHLTFMGIPIEGSMSEFCEKIKEKGFTPIDIKNDLSVFTGRFTGEDVMIFISAPNDGQNVSAIVVNYSESEVWNTLVTSYNYYKNLYTRKYGEPDATKEYNPEYGGSNTALMYALRQEQVDYYSQWRITGGTIHLTIRKGLDINSTFGGRVCIMYLDTQSDDINTQKYLEDI